MELEEGRGFVQIEGSHGSLVNRIVLLLDARGGVAVITVTPEDMSGQPKIRFPIGGVSGSR